MSEDEAVKLTTAGYTADDYDGDAHVPAEEALRRLVEGNRIYVGRSTMSAICPRSALPTCSRTVSAPSPASSRAPTRGWCPRTSS